MIGVHIRVIVFMFDLLRALGLALLWDVLGTLCRRIIHLGTA